MRHRKAGRPLGRNSAHRRALFRNMVTSFLEHERIETTEAKAKEIRPIAERMISLGKRGDLHSRKLAASYLFSPAVVSHLFSEIGPRFSDDQGGYTRMFKTRIRKGDASQMTVIELTKKDSASAEEEKSDPKKEAVEAKKTKAKKPPVKKEKEATETKKKTAKKKVAKAKTADKKTDKEKVAKKKAAPKKKVSKKKKESES